MQTDRASVTALGAAGLQAAHQTLEGGTIFRDPFAVRLFEAASRLAGDLDPFDTDKRSLRLFIAARSRFAEDHLADAIDRGISQLVVLGAGLDTFALRNPCARGAITIFEADHPSTQAFKRAVLREAGVAEPHSTIFVPIDFQTDDVLMRLDHAGFDAAARTYWMWLGVLPYLDLSAIEAMIGAIGSLPGSEITFDYIEPIETYAVERQQHMRATAARVAASGEPWISSFTPAEMHQILRRHGFQTIVDLDIGAIATQYFQAPPGKVPAGPGPHLLHAR